MRYLIEGLICLIGSFILQLIPTNKYIPYQIGIMLVLTILMIDIIKDYLKHIRK